MAMGIRITFFGRTGTVTGSKYLVETGSTRVLVDSRLFHGYKPLRLRNCTDAPQLLADESRQDPAESS